MPGFTEDQMRELKALLKESQSGVADSIRDTVAQYLGEEDEAPLRTTEPSRRSRDSGRHRDSRGKFLSDTEYERIRDEYEQELESNDPYYDYDREYEGVRAPDQDGGYYDPELGYIPEDIMRELQSIPEHQIDAYLADAGYDVDDDDGQYYDDYEGYDEYEQNMVADIEEMYNDKLRQRDEMTEIRIRGLEEELSKAREHDEQRQEQVIRDRAESELGKALDKAGVVSIEAGIKWFGDRVAYDEDTDQVVFEKDGNFVSIEEGLKGEVPRWLKAPKGRQGAGTFQEHDRVAAEDGLGEDEYLAPDAVPDPNGPMGEIMAMEKQVAIARDRASSSNQEGDIVQYQVATTKLNRMKAQAQPEAGLQSDARNASGQPGPTANI